MVDKKFHFKQFSILHQKNGLRVTTDACILGAFSKKDNPKNILDIGTGTGVLALMLAQKYNKAKLTAIDIQEEIIKQAKLNIEESKFKDKIKLHLGNINSYIFDSKFDLIVCNPPYFAAHLGSSNKEKNIALHNDTLSATQLFQAVIKNLNDDGFFWVIYPPFEFQQFENLATDLTLIEKINVYNHPDKLHRIIGCFMLNGTQKFTEKSITLCDKQNNRTIELNRLMADFYI